MHKDFADWYRVVSIEPKADELQKRWAGVAQLSAELTSAQLPELVRLFFGATLKDEAFLELVRTPFKTADDSFPMRDNDAEMRVLAGATLIELLRYSDGWGIASALMVTCMAFSGLRASVIPEIVNTARDYLATTSATLRGGSTAIPDVPKFEEQLLNLKNAFASNAVANLAEPVMAVMASLRKVTEGLQKWATHSTELHRLQREESDALWWVFGNTSRDLQASFGSLDPAAVPIVAGKELADLVQVLPGPFAAPALLSTILRQGSSETSIGKIQLKDAVDACPLEWRKPTSTVDQSHGLQEICTINTSLRRSVETDGKKAWQTLAATSTRIKPSERLDRLDLALQMYHERLLMRAINGME